MIQNPEPRAPFLSKYLYELNLCRSLATAWKLQALRGRWPLYIGETCVGIVRCPGSYKVSADGGSSTTPLLTAWEPLGVSKMSLEPC